MRSLFPRTIQGRLIFSHLIVSLVSVALISIYAGNILFNAVRIQVEHRYEDLIYAAANDLQFVMEEYVAGNASIDQLSGSVEHFFSSEPEVGYTIYRPDGIPILDRSGTLPSPATPDAVPELWDALTSATGEGEYFRHVEKNGETLYLAVKIDVDQQALGVLRVMVPLQDALMPARASLGLLVSAALLVGLGMSVIGYFLARGLAGPIRNITQTAESLASGKMNARVDAPTQPQEIHRLAEAFNNMAVRLQTHVDELRSFVANASHELRTPLTSIKLRVEALRNGALEDPPVTQRFLAEIEGEVDRLSSMVNDLLDLSRIEAGLDPRKTAPVDVAVVANDVVETFKVRADRAGISLQGDIRSGLEPVMGNEDQLRRMLYNLADNAIKYTARGGEVVISLRPAEKPGMISLKVRDTGFGIAAGQLPHIFERFYRVEATRPRFGPSHGSGLGLPIAKSIAEAHGGAIGVTSQLGSGSTFWVELPTVQGAAKG
jgi:signal transduction histidine kinase